MGFNDNQQDRDYLSSRKRRDGAEIVYAVAKKDITEIIDELESDYKWGGSENEEGRLENGIPDFRKARQKIMKSQFIAKRNGF